MLSTWQELLYWNSDRCTGGLLEPVSVVSGRVVKDDMDLKTRAL